MKLKFIGIFVIFLSLLSCATQSTKSSYQPLTLKTHNYNKNGDIVPVSINFSKPFVAGDELTLTHKNNIISSLTLSGELKLQYFHVRIRALGDGKLTATLKKKGKAPVSVSKSISVARFSPVPKRNLSKPVHKGRIKNGSYKMIILNDSAESGYVNKVNVDFGHGKAIVKGSKYLSKNPYFSFKPLKFGKKPTATFKLAI